MAIHLQKGQKVDLRKDNQELEQIMIGMGWDAAKKGGIFGSIDCDTSAVILCENKVLESKKDIICFTNLTHPSGAVKHQGDNLTGKGNGDDERIMIALHKLPAKYERIVFVVNIFMSGVKKQHFGLVKNAFIRIVDLKSNEELFRFNLSDNYDGKTAMIFGEIYRHKGKWKFNPIGEATEDKNISQLVKRITAN